jgi:uncharacterized membrane protein YccF (DUF307 family)
VCGPVAMLGWWWSGGDDRMVVVRERFEIKNNTQQTTEMVFWVLLLCPRLWVCMCVVAVSTVVCVYVRGCWDGMGCKL